MKMLCSGASPACAVHILHLFSDRRLSFHVHEQCVHDFKRANVSAARVSCAFVLTGKSCDS